jgi:ADP-ribosyl-[dinitrogen reductase] hydrolase
MSHRVSSEGQVILPPSIGEKYCPKAVWIALGIVVFLGGVLATAFAYAQIGHCAFFCLGTGAALSIGLILLGLCPASTQTDAHPTPIQVDIPPSTLIQTDTSPRTSIQVDAYPTLIQIDALPLAPIQTSAPPTPIHMNISPTHLSDVPLRPAEIRERYMQLKKGNRNTSLTSYSLIASTPHFTEVKQIVVGKFANLQFSQLEQRAVGVMLGMAVGDAVGAPYEFLPYRELSYGDHEQCSRFKLEPGQWTDDTSMGLCLADSLLENKGLDGLQLMWAFMDWWDHGYNNAFTVTPQRSVGLGGNIGQSMLQFKQTRAAAGAFATAAGNQDTSGNGGLMRLGAVALFARNLSEARELAARQSRVTHQGIEAAGCAELMATMLFTAVHLFTALHTTQIDPQIVKQAIFDAVTDFRCSVPSVNALAQSVSHDAPSGENWNWKNPNFKFHAGRLASQPGYIGSYAMDGLAMALHCVWMTDSFRDAILKAGQHGGDADTVAAIAGQIAGAIYGITSIPQAWVNAVQKWDRGGEIATRAILLLEARDTRLQ